MPERDRRLLAHRRQIDKLSSQTKERGLTLVPTRIYFNAGRAKVEVALAKGREMKRDMDRALREVGR